MKKNKLYLLGLVAAVLVTFACSVSLPSLYTAVAKELLEQRVLQLEKRVEALENRPAQTGSMNLLDDKFNKLEADLDERLVALQELMKKLGEK